MIIDCFTFFNELDLLEYRLEYLYDTVDYFVIVEANLTYSGAAKPMRYLDNISRYHKYSKKIMYMPMSIDPSQYNLDYKPTSFDPTAPQWSVENLQRNHIAKALELFPDDAIVSISDIDEIPSKSAIEMARGILGTEIEACCLEQEMFYYNFRQMTATGWIPGALATNRFAKRVSPQVVRNQAMWGMLHRIPNGGWHLSCWGSPEDISDKIKSFSHQELNIPEFTAVDNIQQRMSDGRDPFDRGSILHVDPMSLPKLPHEIIRIFGKDPGRQIPHFYESIEGWFGPDDILFYKETFDRYPRTAHFVEIGSFKGRSSAFMATEIANSKKSIKFDCVDTWAWSPEYQVDQMFDEFKQNMSPVNGFYTAKRMTSVEAAATYPDNSLDFVFIDADHNYEPVLQDITAWLPKVKVGGILGGHDYRHGPVSAAVHQLLVKVRSTGNCWWMVKQQ